MTGFFFVYLAQANDTAIATAAANGHVEALEALLTHPDVDVNAQDKVPYDVLNFVVKFSNEVLNITTGGHNRSHECGIRRRCGFHDGFVCSPRHASQCSNHGNCVPSRLWDCVTG